MKLIALLIGWIVCYFIFINIQVVHGSLLEKPNRVDEILSLVKYQWVNSYLLKGMIDNTDCLPNTDKYLPLIVNHIRQWHYLLPQNIKLILHKVTIVQMKQGKKGIFMLVKIDVTIGDCAVTLEAIYHAMECLFPNSKNVYLELCGLTRV